MPGLGTHLLVDLYGCPFERLNAPARLDALALEAVRASGATVLGHQVHTFQPHGVTGVVIVAESHLTFHTWPEHGYMAVDYFSCGAHVDLDAAVTVLAEGVQAVRIERDRRERGAGAELTARCGGPPR